MIRLPLSQLGKWDHGQKDMKKCREGGRQTSEWSWVKKSTGNKKGGGRYTTPDRDSWVKPERERERGDGKKTITTEDEGVDERQQEGERLVSKWRKRTELPFVVFPLCSRQTLGAAVTFPTHFPLMPICPPETVEDEKTDCGLVFKAYQLVFACLLRSESLHIPSVILSAGGQL